MFPVLIVLLEEGKRTQMHILYADVIQNKLSYKLKAYYLIMFEGKAQYLA